MTNREAYEEAAGMALDPLFFSINRIDPDAEYPIIIRGHKHIADALIPVGAGTLPEVRK